MNIKKTFDVYCGLINSNIKGISANMKIWLKSGVGLINRNTMEFSEKAKIRLQSGWLPETWGSFMQNSVTDQEYLFRLLVGNRLLGKM